MFTDKKINFNVKPIYSSLHLESTIQWEKLDLIRFSDDIVALLTESEEVLQNILTTMNIILKDQYNMKINKSKTKILVCSRKKKKKKFRCKTCAVVVKQHSHIKNLGSEILELLDEYK